MLKYTEAQVCFSEVPEEITLCINISGCPLHCKGCHSPHLQNDIGEELTPTILSNLITQNYGITCVAFMGGDAKTQEVIKLIAWVKENTKLKVCWYSGRELNHTEAYKYLDYLKVGPYKENLGGLNSPTTNQRFYKIKHIMKDNNLQYVLEDITLKFQRQ